MKKSTKILVGTAIVLSIVLGFFIGISIDFPKTDESNLIGTIGRMNNYRNIKVPENDIKLRSELLSNEALRKGYQQYFSFHYAITEKLHDDIDLAIKTSESIPDFLNAYSKEIENITNYIHDLEKARKDILLAVSSFQKFSEAYDNNIGMIITNANNAIAQIMNKQENVTNFVEAIETFLENNNSDEFSDLKKVHDLLTTNQ